jgi:colicin import membrane protein
MTQNRGLATKEVYQMNIITVLKQVTTRQTKLGRTQYGKAEAVAEAKAEAEAKAKSEAKAEAETKVKTEAKAEAEAIAEAETRAGQ